MQIEKVLKQNENDDDAAIEAAAGMQSLAQGSASADRLRRSQKKAMKLSRDISKIEDNIHDDRMSQKLLINRDLMLNDKKPQYKDPSKSVLSAKTKVNKRKEVSPNHFFKKMVADVPDFEEPAEKMSSPVSGAAISSKAEVGSETQREEEEQAIIDEAAAEAAEFETNSQTTGETTQGAAEKAMSLLKKGSPKSPSKKELTD